MLLHTFTHFGVNKNFAQNFCALWTRFCSLSSHFCKKCILSGINFRAKLTLSAFLHAFDSLLPQTQNYDFRPGLLSRTKCTRCPLFLASGPLLLASGIRAIQGQCHRIHSQLSGSGLAMPLTNSIGEGAEYPKARRASHHFHSRHSLSRHWPFT